MSKVRTNTLRVEMSSAEALWTPETVVLYYGDSAANRIVFDLYNDGEAVDASGYTAALSVKRPDGVLLEVEVGESGGELSCVLTGACYERSGTLGCVLRLTDGDGVSTAVVFSVEVRASADAGVTEVIETETISLTALRTLIDRLETLAATGIAIVGTAETAEDLDGITGAFGQGYVVGDYLYIWTDAGWTQSVKLAGFPGRGIVSVVRTSGDGSPGTTDTYTVTYTDATTTTFLVRHGANGTNGTNGADGASVTEETEFASLNTTAKTLPGAINEIVDAFEDIADALDAIMGEEEEV
jgi:hypothetical protein